MKYFLLFMLMINFKISLCHITHYLKCSHSRYFLNFFNHNERFLLQFEKNKEQLTIENLMNYGKALQTHGKVIMIFLEDLIYNNSKKFPYTLITVNMYLNNISGSLNMIAKIDDDEKNDAQKLLEGYKIIHFAVKEQLTSYINGYCFKVPFQENKVICNPPINENKYNITDLIKINNDLIEKILTQFKLTLIQNSYERFHPKNILFYDIMTLQILTDKNNSIKIDNSQHIELNLLRFTRLNFKCTNGTHLTIQDIFEYMKYDFTSKDVLAYIITVIGATFRPIAILLRNYLTLIQVASLEYSDSVKFWVKKSIIKMGQQIMKYIIDIISLSMYDNKRPYMQNIILNGFINTLNNYIASNKLSEIDINHNNILKRVLLNFFINSKLYFTSDIVLTNKKMTANNADAIITELEKIMEIVEIYISDLKKWNEYFNFIVKSFNIRSYNVSNFKNFIGFKVLDRICNTESHSEIYNASMNDNNKIDIGYYEDKKDVNDGNIEFNLENLKDKDDENNIDANDSFEHQSNYKPLYMIDYWPYNL
ncbi:uncharacterized protein LOC126902315 isoform X1 [Daktulosphaira vitifoliae]|uniref:uncharacterized protein LOC126902315 isoform X1 n=1 Tax=Daktulosphaira vitifoliae TaxID=58002 RepID=UPI0021AA99FD|nr:uncharacterized protein LOC126902315 isoform X1 [Daktulosphaira vitifoliae]